MTTLQAVEQDEARIADPLGRTPDEPLRRRTTPLLVATDGTRGGAAAMRFAAALAAREGLPVEAVTVEPDVHGDVTGFSLKPDSLDWPALVPQSPLGRVRTQTRMKLECPVSALHVEFGNVAQAVARLATELRAPMVFVGLSRHHPPRRLFTRETAARLLRYVEVPVIAVEARVRALPRTAVVGVDFGSASRRAARAALALLDRPARMILVHVRAPLPTTEPQGAAAVYDAGVRAEFERLSNLLGREGVTVTTMAVDGVHPAEALDRIARREEADLVAVGSHGRDFVARILIGSVPTQLLRSSERTVLVAPPTGDGVELLDLHR
jgi:nucleotide-binding universal stress UspA family protein